MTDHPGKAALATIEKHVKDMEGRGPVLDGNFGFTIYKDQFQSIAAYVAELEDRLEKAEVRMSGMMDQYYALLEDHVTAEAALAEARKVIERYEFGLKTLATTFYKEDQHQEYAKHVLQANKGDA
jgi:exonuclease VII small subunit